MRTHQRGYKSARIWESRRQSWIPVCFNFSPSFKQTSWKNAGVATTKSRRLPKLDADQINKNSRQTYFGRINAPRLLNMRYQKLQLRALTERKQSECPRPTTLLPAVAATWLSAPDATSTTLKISCISTTSLSFDLATLMYATLIINYLSLNTKLN